MSGLTRTWAALIALAVATTLVATMAPASPPLRIAAAGLLLALGWGKARLILGRFLGLEAAAPGWRAGLGWAIAAFLAVALGLYAAAR